VTSITTHWPKQSLAAVPGGVIAQEENENGKAVELKKKKIPA
jgi:hypothetical protein